MGQFSFGVETSTSFFCKFDYNRMKVAFTLLVSLCFNILLNTSQVTARSTLKNDFETAKVDEMTDKIMDQNLGDDIFHNISHGSGDEDEIADQNLEADIFHNISHGSGDEDKITDPNLGADNFHNINHGPGDEDKIADQNLEADI